MLTLATRRNVLSSAVLGWAAKSFAAWHPRPMISVFRRQIWAIEDRMITSGTVSATGFALAGAARSRLVSSVGIAASRAMAAAELTDPSLAGPDEQAT